MSWYVPLNISILLKNIDKSIEIDIPLPSYNRNKIYLQVIPSINLSLRYSTTSTTTTTLIDIVLVQ